MNDLRRHRADLAAVGILLAIPLVLFADVLFLGSTFYYRDLTFYFYPANFLLRSIVLGGEFPFWNPYFSAGQPLAANPEFSVFYPLRWLVLLPDYHTGFKLHILVHVAVGLLGMYHLLRFLRARPEGALLGALSFGISGFFLSYLNIPPFLFALAWVPLVLAFSMRFLLRPGVGTFALASLAWGMQLIVGEPTTILQTGVLVGAVAIYLGSRVRGARSARLRAVARNLLLVLLLCGGSLAVGAAQLLPTLEHVPETSRAGGLPWVHVREWSTPPVRMAEVVFPDFMGPHEFGYGWWWGRQLYREQREPYLQSIYFGLPLAVFAVAGLVARRRGWIAVLLVSAAGFFIAIGENTPLLRFLYDSGVFRSFRYPEKFLLTALFPLVLFGALMLDRAMRGDRKVRRNAALVAGVSALIAIVLAAATWSDAYLHAARWVFGFSPATQIDYIAPFARRSWVIAAIRGALLLLLVAAVPRMRRPVWTAAMIALILFDLGRLGNRILPRIHERFFDPPEITARLDPDRHRYRIFHEADLEQVLSMNVPQWNNVDAYLLRRNALYPRLPAAWGFSTVLESDYDETNLRPTVDLMHVANTLRLIVPQRFPGPLPSISNARYVLRHPAAGVHVRRPGEDPEVVQPLELIDLGPSERYYFAGSMEKIGSWQEFARRIVAAPVGPSPAFVGFDPQPFGKGIVSNVMETANSIELNVAAEARSYLVLSVTPHKYWRATIDGTPATLHVTNIGYQGLWVPEGDHTVRLVYRNTLVIVSAIVSALSVMAFLTLAIVFRRRP